MKNFLWICLLFLFCAKASSGIVKERDVWKVAGEFSEAEISKKLLEIEAFAHKDKLEAAKMAERLARSADASEIVAKDGTSLALMLDSLALFYRDGGSYGNDEMIARAGELLEKYQKEAEGKRLDAYLELYRRQCDGFFRLERRAELLDVMKKMVLYNPFDYSNVAMLLKEVSHNPENAGNFRDFLTDFTKAGGKITPEMEFLSLLLEKKSADAYWWLENNYAIDKHELLRSLDYLAAFLTIEDKDSLLAYQKALTTLALRLPVTESGKETFAAVLNLREKITTVTGKKNTFTE